MDSENYYAREVQCVEMADKKKEDKRGETFELEVVLHYKNTDGSTGSIIKVKSLKK